MTDASQEVAQADHMTKSNFALTVTPAKIWAFASICATVLAGAFGFGIFVEKTRSEAAVTVKDQEISKLKTGSGDYQRAVEALKRALEDAAGIRQRLETKAELLNRLVGYLQGRDDVSKLLLVDVVCSMWRESQTRRVRLDTEPLRIDERDLVRGLPPDVEKFLITQGVSAKMLDDIKGATLPEDVSQVDRLRVPFPDRDVMPSRLTQESLGRVMKLASLAEVIKVVRLSDGSQYQMPQEIALAVHLKPDCAPRR